MFDSKVHLIRSDEFKEEDFSQVVNLLKQFNGPIEFISAETTYLQSAPPVLSWMTKLEFEKKNPHNFLKTEIKLVQFILCLNHHLRKALSFLSRCHHFHGIRFLLLALIIV